MKTIVVPTFKYPWRNYTYDYVKTVYTEFEQCGYRIEFSADLLGSYPVNFANSGCFYAVVNNNLVLFDQSEYYDENSWNCVGGVWSRNPPPLSPRYVPEQLKNPIFKRMMVPFAKYSNNVYPLGPFICTPSKLECLRRKHIATYSSNVLLSTNRVYGNAVYTRGIAFSKLNLPKTILMDTSRTTLQDYYKRLETCFASLNITGASRYTQDSAPIENMLLGVCVISNTFDIKLPFNKQLIAGKHYIRIEDDYSDINERIMYAFNNREEVKSIGTAAYDLLNETIVPEKRVEWIEKVIRDYYE